MVYTVKTLAENKEIRADFVKNDIFLLDYSGNIFLDFVNDSMRANHIKLFETLYEIGGSELLDALISAGKTCLTRDKNASKTGVYELKEGYYLKTNCSAINAFTSIIFGIVGWVDYSDNVSCDDILIADEPFDVAIEPAEDSEEPENEIRLKLTVKNNPDTFGTDYIFKDELSGDVFDTFYVPDLLVPVKASNMEDVVALSVHNRTIGFKYTVKGMCGFIGADMKSVTDALYDNILISSEGRVIACKNDYEGRSLLFFSKKFDVEEEFPVFNSNEAGFCYNDSDKFFYNIKIEEYYGFETKYTVVNADVFGFEENFYVTAENFGVSFERYEKYKTFYLYTDSTDDISVFHCKENGRGCRGNKIDLYMLNELCGKDAPDVNVCRGIGTGNYEFDFIVVEKEGFYGIARFTKKGEYVSMIAPYAFTRIQPVDDTNFVIVERFGKKGIFNLREGRYVIPCEFDKLNVYSGWNLIDVCKMEFEGELKYILSDSGEISGDPEWKKSLRRKGVEN